MTCCDKNNLGFTLIEVLVGVLILSLAILAMTAGLRQAYSWKVKQEAYEIISISTTSLVKRILAYPEVKEENNVLPDNGTFNQVTYSYECSQVTKGNNTVMSADVNLKEASLGKYEMFLDICSLQVDYKKYNRKVDFYRTRYTKL